MQGKDSNKNSFIDEAFVDHAWEEMHKMLDQEMPVMPRENGKKKYLVLLLLLLTGFSAGVGVMYFFTPSTGSTTVEETPPKKEKVKPIGPIAKLPKKAQKPTDQKNKISTTKPNPSENKITKPAFTYNQKTIVTKSVANAHSVEWIPSPKIQEVVEVVSEPSKAVASTPRANFINLNTVDLQSINFAKLNENEPQIKSELIKVRTNKWKWSAQGGILVAAPGVTGWTLGLNSEFQISPRFSLQTGLHYTSYRWKKGKEEVVIENVRLEDAFQLPEEFLSNNISVNTAVPALALEDYAKANNVEIKNRNYLGIPLILSYRLIPALKINLGGQFAFQAKDLFSSGQSSQENALSSQDLTEPNRTIDSSNSINKMDATGVFGLTFFPTKRTGIDLRYNIGLMDYTTDDVFGVDQFDNNKSFQVSLIHYFGRH